MQLPELSNTSNVVRLADGARRTRVMYAGDMEFAKAQFQSVAPQLQLVPASILSGAASLQPADTPDVALIDCGAPGVDARTVIEAIRARGLDIPIVLALDPGAADGGPTRITAELRVDDYTVKLPGWLARLTSRLEFAIAHHRRRRSLDAVQASADRLRTVVETAPVCLARVTNDGTILAMNAAAMKMVNAEAPEHVLGKSLLSFVGPAGGDAVRRFLDGVSAGQPGSLEIETTDGAGVRILDTRAVPLSPDAEGRASALLVLRDATERKRLEESVVAASRAGQALGADQSVVQERDSLKRQLDAALEEAHRIQTEREALLAEAEASKRAYAAAEQQLAEARADHQRAIAERDAIELQRAALAADRDALAGERNALAEHRDVLAARHDSLSGERDALSAERDSLAVQRDLLAAQRDSLLSERDSLASERNLLTTERDSLASERNLLTTERDSLASERSLLTTERDSLAAEAVRARELRDAAMAAESGERDAQVERLRAAEADRAQLVSRCEALEALVASSEARHAAEHNEYVQAREQAEARIRLLQEPDPVAAEREALQASLGTLRAQFDVMRASLDAAEARHATDLQQQRAATADLEGRLRGEIAARAALAAERDALRAALDAAEARVHQLQTALDQTEAGRSAQMAEHDAAYRALQEQVEELHRRVDAAIAERDAARAELGAIAGSAEERTRHLQGALDELRGARNAQAAESEAVRRELLERVDDLQQRLQSAAAEREAIRTEMRLALDTADARTAQLQASLADVQSGHEAAAAQGDAARRSLTERVEELQRRLDSVILDRESLEAALESLKAEHTSQMHDAATQRDQLQRRLAERDAEYEELAARSAALEHEARRAREEAETLAQAVAAASAQAPAEPDAGSPPAVDARAGLDDAQAAFKEAVQLLSGELQSAVQTTRAQQAALLRSHPAYEALEERLRLAEADCRRLVAEREERETALRALQDEVEQLIDVRREQRKELVRALQESDETERRAAERLAECVRLRHTLGETQMALQRLSKWASDQSTRLGPLPAGSRKAPARIASNQPDSQAADAGGAAPAPEASWS